MKLTIGEFRKMTAELPEETIITYHAYYKGCCLRQYSTEDVWMFPKGQTPTTAIVINPGDDYDPRRPK